MSLVRCEDSWDAEKHPLTNMDELAKIAAETCETIVITGSEPSMWNLEYLTSKLKAWRKYSCGSFWCIFAHWNFGLDNTITKKLAEPQADVIEKADELKCIIYNHDFKLRKIC